MCQSTCDRTWRTPCWPRQVWRWFSVVVLMACVIPTAVCGAPVGHVGDGCDWVGSGLESPGGRGVQPVYVRCSQGSVRWLYPRGALRVVLRLGSGPSPRDFVGCLKAEAGFAGARVFLEEPARLLPLFSRADGRSPHLPRCFRSRNAHAALYVEAAPGPQPLQRQVAAFKYHLTPLALDATDSRQDCRPCSSDELLRVFCTSDFVVRGSINAIRNNEELERTEVGVGVSKLWRQTAPVFQKSEPLDTNSLAPAEGLQGTVHVPIHCGAKHGDGEFVFMGRLRLGEPELLCAPRMEDWEDAVRKGERDGSLQCEVDS